jgi:hypothetical protein
MYKYEVGQVIDKFVMHPEGARFDISDSGAVLQIFFNNPTSDEISQFKEGKRFEIRFIEIRNVIMVLLKIGNLNWMDATYTPHLSKNLTKFELPNNNQGLALTIMLIDARTGEIKALRLVGLSEKFTKKLFGTIMELKITYFDKLEYAQTINSIYASYSTDKLVKLSNDYYKIN